MMAHTHTQYAQVLAQRSRIPPSRSVTVCGESVRDRSSEKKDDGSCESVGASVNE